jgi:hypothetical protein
MIVYLPEVATFSLWILLPALDNRRALSSTTRTFAPLESAKGVMYFEMYGLEVRRTPYLPIHKE